MPRTTRVDRTGGLRWSTCLRVLDDPEAVAIEHVTPDVDGGRFAVKRVADEAVVVEADVFAYGHVELAVRLEHRRKEERRWRATWLTPVVNDRWRCGGTLARVR